MMLKLLPNFAPPTLTSFAAFSAALIAAWITALASTEAQANVDYDIEIPYIESGFSSVDIEILLATKQATFHTPGGQSYQLELHSVQRQNEVTTIHCKIGKLSCTISQKHQRYFATIATPDGVYRLQGNADGGRILPHIQLAQRSLGHNEDFRVQP